MIFHLLNHLKVVFQQLTIINLKPLSFTLINDLQCRALINCMLQTIISIVCLSDLNIRKCLITKYNLSFINKIEKPSKLTITANIKFFNRGVINATASISNNKKKFSYGEFNFIVPEIFKL